MCLNENVCECARSKKHVLHGVLVLQQRVLFSIVQRCSLSMCMFHFKHKHNNINNKKYNGTWKNRKIAILSRRSQTI